MKRSDSRSEHLIRELAPLVLFLLLVITFFAPVLLGGATLLPFENLYRFPPWQESARALGIGQPHNSLLDDLVLENYPWKKFIVDSISHGELPLWNPYILAGQPFMAAGQNGALYPLGVIFYLLPLTSAYGVFVALHFWIAAAAMFLLARVFRLGAFGATVSALVYAFSGFMVVSVVFPMVISAAAWLPAILAAVELTLREEEKRRNYSSIPLETRRPQPGIDSHSLSASKSEPESEAAAFASAPNKPSPNIGESVSTSREVFFALLTSVLLGLQFLAGHIEISYYILLVLAFYCIWRVAGIFKRELDQTRRLPGLRAGAAVSSGLIRPGLLLASIVTLGFGLAAIQLVPLYELLQRNFRAGSTSYDQVAGWALPLRQVLTFIIPDFFGNPTHHFYLDVYDWTLRTAPTGTIFWGIKNYVEAGSYVGIFPLVLAILAAVSSMSFLWRRGRAAQSDTSRPEPRTDLNEGSLRFSPTLFFVALAIVSLLFAFGTPLYAILFYALPGYNQLHTAFRWIFPYTLSLAFLAGAGAQSITRHFPASAPEIADETRTGPRDIPLHAVPPRLTDYSVLSLLGWLLLAAGLAILSVLGLSLVWQSPFQSLADRIIAISDLARPVFQTGRAFWSYEFRNLLIFGTFLAGAGLTVSLVRSPTRISGRIGGYPIWQPVALAVIVLDLFIFGIGFNSTSDPRLVEFIPPAIQFLQKDHSLFRVSSYDLPGRTIVNPDTGIQEDVAPERILNPNAGIYYGIQDIRGYDSIIAKDYAEYMGAIAPQDELLYNRIAPFYSYEPLSSPLLNLLNVKYVLSTRPLPNPGYELVFDQGIKIYQNQRALPRAFLVSHARVIPDRANLLQALAAIDPSSLVLLEEEPHLNESDPETALLAPTIEKYSGSEVLVATDSPQSAYLVLGDAFFPGWIAEIDGQETQIYRADYDLRAVVVPAGKHSVRFKYSPLSFKIGGYTSLVAGMIVLLGLIALGWRRFAPSSKTGEGGQVRIVAKNSIVPMAASFLNQGLNFAAQFVILRLLGPTGAGRYAFAVIVWLYWTTVTDFGLGLLMTREVSRDRSLSNRYLTNTALLRILLTIASSLPLALLLFVFVNLANDINLASLAPDTVTAIILLWVSLIPANLSASLSFLFNAHEQFEYPTAATVATNILSISLQIAALLLGFGIVGMAAVSIVANSFTLLVLFYLVRSRLFAPRWEPDLKLMRWMFFESYPLMMNNLLSSLFFRIDNFILQPLRGDTILGYYNTGYKFINALNFIPSNFTLAIFPMLSRYAANAKEAMQRALILSIKLLLWISLPVTVATSFIAYQIIGLYGGEKFIPDSAIALQWLIWFLPFSFVNSVVHYVLIALGQQRFLTKAFSIGLAFNIAANIIAIQAMSYRGAALVTVLSEIVLLIPFYYSLRKNLAPLPILDMVWRPAVAAAAMAGMLYLLLPRMNLFVALAAASFVYVFLGLLLGALGPDEWLLVRRLAPRRLEGLVSLLSRPQSPS